MGNYTQVSSPRVHRHSCICRGVRSQHGMVQGEFMLHDACNAPKTLDLTGGCFIAVPIFFVRSIQ